VVFFLTGLIYLTQEDYILLKQSNKDVIQTDRLIKEHQRLSIDFKSAIIYIPTFKKGVSKVYYSINEQGVSNITTDLQHLKALVDAPEQRKLDSLSNEIKVQVRWMMNKNVVDSLLFGQKNAHIESIISIQNVIKGEASRLEQLSIAHVKIVDYSLIKLHTRLVTLICFTSVIIVFTLLLIFFQFRRVKLQNKSLMDIAWMQSHTVRAEVVTILGLAQLFNHDTDKENGEVIKKLMNTTEKLDGIVKEINAKTSV